MPTKIFVNLAVKDLDRSKALFERLGFTFNPQFTDETAACMVVTDDIYAMLLTHPKFKEFTKKDVADAHKTTEVLTCLSFDSKEKVNEIVDNAVAAGGNISLTEILTCLLPGIGAIGLATHPFRCTTGLHD